MKQNKTFTTAWFYRLNWWFYNGLVIENFLVLTAINLQTNKTVTFRLVSFYRYLWLFATIFLLAFDYSSRVTWDKETMKTNLYETEHSINRQNVRVSYDYTEEHSNESFSYMLSSADWIRLRSSISLIGLWWMMVFAVLLQWNWILVTNMLFSITIVSRLTSFAFNRHPVDTVCSSLSWGTTFVYYSVDFSAVKFKREIHFTNISNPHTMTALFASRLHSCSIVWLAK